MTDILSQDEIDQLLTAISSGDIKSEDFPSQTEQKKVKIYDFKRPDKFSKDQIRTVQMMHETFARLTTTALSAKLRSMVQVHVTSVDQLTYEEFIRSIPNPTTITLINMDPLKGSSILEIDPSITFTIIDRLFGGIGEHYKINRELTDIEMSVIEGVVVNILNNLREAWSTVIDLRPRLGDIETNPQFAQIVPPNEMVMLITLETKIGESEGMMNLCIPYITIEPIIQKLSAQYWFSSIRRGESEINKQIIQGRVFSKSEINSLSKQIYMITKKYLGKNTSFIEINFGLYWTILPKTKKEGASLIQKKISEDLQNQFSKKFFYPKFKLKLISRPQDDFSKSQKTFFFL